MPKLVKLTAVFVFTVTAVVWAYALTQHTFLKREFWLYVGIFTVPCLAVCGSVWLTLLKSGWWKLIGAIFLIAGLFVWGVALLLVHVGFKIH